MLNALLSSSPDNYLHLAAEPGHYSRACSTVVLGRPGPWAERPADVQQ